MPGEHNQIEGGLRHPREPAIVRCERGGRPLLFDSWVQQEGLLDYLIGTGEQRG